MTAKVLEWSEESFRRVNLPMRAAELMIEAPGMVVCGVEEMRRSGRVWALRAGEELEEGKFYVMVAVERVHSKVSAVDMADIVAACSNKKMPRVPKVVAPPVPEGGGGGGGDMGLAAGRRNCRQWRPTLEPIFEGGRAYATTSTLGVRLGERLVCALELKCAISLSALIPRAHSISTLKVYQGRTKSACNLRVLGHTSILRNKTIASLAVLIPTLIISVSFALTKEVRYAGKYASRHAYNEASMNMRTAATVYDLISSSAINTARFVSSSIDKSQSSLSDFQTKVSPFLFLAFKTLPLAQISYIGADGLYFSYYTEGNQTFAMYSDSSNISFVSPSQNGSVAYNCAVQPVDCFTGSMHSDANISSSIASINASWVQEVLNSPTGHHASIGWARTGDKLILNAAATEGGGGVLSLGIPVKALTNAILMKDYSFLNTKDDLWITQMGYNDNRVPVLFNYTESVLKEQTGDVSCNSSVLRKATAKIEGTNYMIHCASIEIAGVKSVSEVVVPQKGLARLIAKHSKIVLTLLVLILTLGALYTTFVTFLFIRTTRIKMYLQAALVRQFNIAQEAERKSVNKSIAFASASHDVRSSLAALDGLITLCALEADPNSELYTNLDQMRELASDLLGILNSILDTSKIEAGKMQLAEEEFDLAQVLEDVVNLYYPLAKKKGIDMVLDPCDGSLLECSMVKGDRGKLKQILINLLHNAIKFTSDGHISVRAWLRGTSLEDPVPVPDNVGFQNCFKWLFYKRSEAQGDMSTSRAVQQRENSLELVVEVDDTGKGIPREKQKSVFEDFVQVKDTAHEKGGTGLGLGIVRLLVRLMGGDINVVDKDLGAKGACFRFNIFLSRSEEGAPDAAAADSTLPSCHIPSVFHQTLQPNVMSRSDKEHSRAVLFLDGDERRRTIQKYLESAGITTLTMDGLERFVSILEKIKYKQYLTQLSSSRNSEFGSFNITTLDFTEETREMPMDIEEGRNLMTPKRKATSTSRFLLIVIDLNVADFNDENFSEFRSMLADFRKDLGDLQCKIVWLRTSIAVSESRRLDEKQLAEYEHIIIKPLHGFQLYNVLRLLPEFGGASTIQHHRAKPTTDPSSSVQFAGIRSSSEIIELRQPQESQPAATSHNGPLHGKKILVAEDQPVLRMVAKRILDQLGATTRLCENGEEALQAVCEALREAYEVEGSLMKPPYDFILMDCQMPVMSGHEATRRIRIEERHYHIRTPIIALTAHADPGENPEIFLSGMDYHLTKPLAIEKLLKAINFFDPGEEIN
ncbi:hypothetical protein Syun_008063 [Stephania yunnanensis]|uniref:histidine kinase n=1 Tax=Stephania yunnanensis TaxID=152371 RepID=A0AAP0PZ27_9MAGN